MAGSSNNGKLYTALMLSKLHEFMGLSRILDVGVGSGTYVDLLRQHLKAAHWTAIEVWEPYLAAYDLESKYDSVMLGDARTVDYAALGSFDLSIAGDMAEHMEKEEALTMVENLLDVSRVLLLALPIVHSPQGEVHGNPFERHVKDDWSNNEVRGSFPHIATAYIHNHKGVYFLTKDPAVTDRIKAIHQVVAQMTRRKLTGHRVIFSTR